MRNDSLAGSRFQLSRFAGKVRRTAPESRIREWASAQMHPPLRSLNNFLIVGAAAVALMSARSALSQVR